MQEDETIAGSSDFALRQMRVLLDERSHLEDRRLPSERALAEQLGVGRRILRRALEVLEAEGHLWRHQGKGTFIGPRPLRGEVSLVELSSRTNPLEVMEARLEIEPGLARLAALRAAVMRSSRVSLKTRSGPGSNHSSSGTAASIWLPVSPRLRRLAGKTIVFVIDS